MIPSWASSEQLTWEDKLSVLYACVTMQNSMVELLDAFGPGTEFYVVWGIIRIGQTWGMIADFMVWRMLSDIPSVPESEEAPHLLAWLLEANALA